MTKKDYVLVAEAIKETKAEWERKADAEIDEYYDGYGDAINEMVDRFSKLAKVDNPRFDRVKFEQYIYGN